MKAKEVFLSVVFISVFLGFTFLMCLGLDAWNASKNIAYIGFLLICVSLIIFFVVGYEGRRFSNYFFLLLGLVAGLFLFVLGVILAFNIKPYV